MAGGAKIMKKSTFTRVALILGAAVALAACQSTEPILFIATPGYVDAQVAMREEALRQEYDGRIAELEQELEAQRQVADELANLSSVISDIEASNSELQALASQVEGELESIPLETIQTIVDVLTRYVQGNQ